MRRALLSVCLALLALPGAASAQDFPDQSEFQKVQLNDRPGEPMSLAVLPDARVLHTARTGEVRIHNPRNGLNTLVINMADTQQNPRGLYQHDEEGLQGIAVDPDFESNRWVYLYYSPRLNTPVDVVGTGINEGDAPLDVNTPEDRARLALFAASPTTSYALLSRFKFQSNRLDLSSEQEILRVPMDRGICCHVGGQIEFDYAGNLYLSTGDDTNPFFSSGYSPLDDRPTRNPAFDARRTSGNTNDLRGKILRIRVSANGSYTIPNGNLFGRNQARTRPEIYAMGLRNPFRFAVNKRNGDVYVGDYSPDAQNANPAARARGPGPLDADPPARQLRLAVLRHAGQAVRRLRLHAERPEPVRRGVQLLQRRPTTRRNNTGLRRVPQVVWPEVWYSYPAGDEGLFPELLNMRGGDGIGPMGGPAYEFNADNRSREPLAARVRRAPAVLRVDARLLQGVRAQPARTAASSRRCTICSAGRRAPTRTSSRTTRWTRSSVRTVRSTRSSTATGSSPRTRRRSSSRIDFVRGGEYTPVVQVSADPDVGDGAAADRAVLQRGHARTPTATPSRTRGTSTPTAPSTRAWRTRRSPTRSAASSRPRCG